MESSGQKGLLTSIRMDSRRGKAKLIPVEDRDLQFFSSEKGEYPLLLIQRPSLFQSGLLSSKSENLGMVQREPLLEINPDDAGSLGIEDGEAVRILNPAGRSMKIKVKVSKRPAKGS